MISLRIRAAFAAAALSVLAVPAPAQAHRGPVSPVSATSAAALSLAVRDDGTGAVSQVELLCHPTGGTHPQAAAACAALDAAGGAPDRLTPVTGVFCYQLYQPVTASVTGSWLGKPVRWEQTFGNGCELHTRTGPVFRF